ncbi:hypothetical protein M758_8G124400 [Ceratodon purpureus]|nr:hypothetical protein M758_8G124400 [Ceratodon purpureus]
MHQLFFEICALSYVFELGTGENVRGNRYSNPPCIVGVRIWKLLVGATVRLQCAKLK